MPTIAEIGTNRLIDVLVKDKNKSPAKVIAILKSEITSLLNCYMELDDEIKVKIEEERGRITFKINATAIRLKDFGTVL